MADKNVNVFLKFVNRKEAWLWLDERDNAVIYSGKRMSRFQITV